MQRVEFELAKLGKNVIEQECNQLLILCKPLAFYFVATGFVIFIRVARRLQQLIISSNGSPHFCLDTLMSLRRYLVKKGFWELKATKETWYNGPIIEVTWQLFRAPSVKVNKSLLLLDSEKLEPKIIPSLLHVEL